MSFWRKISPTGAAKDFFQVWSDNPYRWPVLAASITATAVIMGVAIPKSERIQPRKPDIFYIRTFQPGRTDAQIEASNLANQKLQDEIRANEEKRVEFRKEMYREIGRASGLDVDAMERQIAADKAAEDRAAAQQRKEAQERSAKAYAKRLGEATPADKVAGQ